MTDSTGATTVTTSEPDPISNFATEYVSRVVQEVGFCHPREATCPDEATDSVTSTTEVSRVATSVLNPDTGRNRELSETTVVNGRMYSREVERGDCPVGAMSTECLYSSEWTRFRLPKIALEGDFPTPIGCS